MMTYCTISFREDGSQGAILDERVEGALYHQKADEWPDPLTLRLVFEEFTPEEVTAHEAEELRATAPKVPASVTALQARRALSAAGLRNTVETWVAQQPIEVQDAWNYADPVRRDNATLLAGAAALGWTSEQLDQLFIAAGAL